MSAEALSLLVVEDNATDLFLLNELLERSRLNIKEITRRKRLAETLTDLQERNFDLILLDLNLPDSFGEDTFLAAYEHANDAAVIVLTGFNDESTAQNLVSLGAQDYLVKGDFSAQELARAIRYALERRRMIKREQQSVVKLRELSRQQRLLLEHTGDFVYEQNPNRTFTYLSPAIKRITGYDVAEWRECFLDFFTDNPINKQAIQLYKDDMNSVDRDEAILMEIRHKHGGEVYLEVCEHRIIDEGRVIGVVGVASDVTERIRFKGVAERLSLAIQATAASVVVTDEKGIIEEINPAFTEMSGYERSEVVGRNPRILKGNFHEPGFYENLWARISSGKTWTGHMINRRKNGEPYHVAATITPILGPAGEVTGYVGVERDISHEVIAQIRLQESEELFRSLSTSAPLGILQTDFSGLIKYINPFAQKIYGMEEEALLDRHWIQILQTVDTEMVAANWKKAVTSREILSFEFQFLKRSSDEVNTARVRISPMLTSNDSTPDFVVVLEDITDLKRLEAQLLQAQKIESIGALAAGIAHEINSPVQFIGSNTNFLQKSFKKVDKLFNTWNRFLNADNPAEQNKLKAEFEQTWDEKDFDFTREEIFKALGETKEGIERVAKIVRSIKEFAHPSGTEKALVDLNQTFETAISVCRNEWKYFADIDLRLDSSIPKVSCVGTEISQVFINLITNAAHAISETLPDKNCDKGLITVSSMQQDGFVEFRVNDNGAGIPNEARSRIFDPFFTTKKVGKGTGQGLSIARAIVKKHGGELEFQTKVEQGTTFILRLPIKLTADISKLQVYEARELN